MAKSRRYKKEDLQVVEISFESNTEYMAKAASILASGAIRLTGKQAKQKQLPPAACEGR